MWHGISDDYNGDWGVGDLLRKNIPGIYIKSICIGDNIDNVDACRSFTDKKNSIYGNASAEIEYACKIIREDENLKKWIQSVRYKPRWSSHERSYSALSGCEGQKLHFF